jgi:hypothetical protein
MTDALGDIYFDRVNNATFDDANGNGLPDFVDILNGTSTDANANGIPDETEPYFFEFSLDIGSDTEMSDPAMDGDEAFDPGDVYRGGPGPRVSPPGQDAFKDDMAIFGLDPWPDPPDPLGATIVPVGTGSAQTYANYFDLDGHDQTDFSLIGVQYPLPAPPSVCVHSPEFLIVSIDDDMTAGWPWLDVPVTAPSPAGIVSYGTTAGRDELLGATVALQPTPPPFPIVQIYPVADEIAVHQSLAPNPDAGDPDDDDVDSLDVVEAPASCPQWFFSPDHEGHVGLDPGGIYEVTPTGPVQVIDEFIHLGIPEDADIDAFEFTVLDPPDQPRQPMLALLFSVDDDDPVTPGDESGGMDPTAIYVSWMMGFSELFCDPLGDDVDALALWIEPLESGACCYGVPESPQCLETSEVICQMQYAGDWKGAGTDCSDWDGSGFADICEELGACCDPVDGSCTDLTLAACTAGGGVWYGPGTNCETTVCPQPCGGDLDGDGDADLDDYIVFDAAMAGPGIPTGNPAADYDGDLDCDLQDFAAWSMMYPCP